MDPKIHSLCGLLSPVPPQEVVSHTADLLRSEPLPRPHVEHAGVPLRLSEAVAGIAGGLIGAGENELGHSNLHVTVKVLAG